jgi:hypothetical protein
MTSSPLPQCVGCAVLLFDPSGRIGHPCFDFAPPPTWHMRCQLDPTRKEASFLRSLTGSFGDGMNFVDLLPPHELLGHDRFPLSAATRYPALAVNRVLLIIVDCVNNDINGRNRPEKL